MNKEWKVFEHFEITDHQNVFIELLSNQDRNHLSYHE